MKTLIITAADSRFRPILDQWKLWVLKQPHDHLIYDIGFLGEGVQKFASSDHNTLEIFHRDRGTLYTRVIHNNFLVKGYYNDVDGKWKSTGWHKPRIIKDALLRGDNIIYLDADAFITKYLEINFNFDIGVVRREPNPDKNDFKLMMRGEFNAGVLFFRNCAAVKRIVSEWLVEIETAKNDQLALNNVLKRNEGKINIKVFGTEYNSTNPNNIIHHSVGDKKLGKRVRF